MGKNRKPKPQIGQGRLIDRVREGYDKGRKFGYQEGVFASHAVWIEVINSTAGVGPKTQEKLEAAARAFMAARLNAREGKRPGGEE
jgi:hypothetical protein